MIAPRPLRITLLCEVLDNFGDAGITWRLACQLANEWQAQVTIAIDQPALLTLWHTKRQARNSAPAISIARLQDLSPDKVRPDLIIAMLGSSVPPALRRHILEHQVSWIRYEYLSAESWIDDFHLRASVKPDDGTTEWFYYPGYTPASGGLLRERGLLAELDRFTANDKASSRQRQQWLRAHALDSPEGHFRVCLFGYAEPATRQLVQALLEQQRPVSIFVSASLAKGLELAAGDPRVRIHPWLDQPDFDRLLASCELNLVRGEDSWLRAQWTGQPMFWQPYRQADAGHLDKLTGYLDRLLANAEPAAAQAIRQAMLALNNGGDPASALTGWFACLKQIQSIHRQWRQTLSAQIPLSERLLGFCRDQLQLHV